MNSFYLTSDTIGNDARCSSLLSELKSGRTQPVFRTWVPEIGKSIVFCTTNEKVHLVIGRLSAMGLRTLAKIFEETTKHEDQMLFSFEQDEGKPSQNLFITASMSESDGRVFHLAPGH